MSQTDHRVALWHTPALVPFFKCLLESFLPCMDMQILRSHAGKKAKSQHLDETSLAQMCFDCLQSDFKSTPAKKKSSFFVIFLFLALYSSGLTHSPSSMKDFASRWLHKRRAVGVQGRHLRQHPAVGPGHHQRHGDAHHRLRRLLRTGLMG